MSYSQTLISYGLEDNRVVLILVLELPLPRNRTILPNSMHTVKITKHIGEASGFIDGHLALKILTYRLPQVNRLKTSPPNLYKPFHALRGCRLGQSTILIACVYRQSIRKHLDYCSAFLQCDQTQFTNRINTLDKPWIKFCHCIHNAHEQFPSHSISPTKINMTIGRILHKGLGWV